MITRFGQWVTVLILVVILVLSALPQVARGEEEGTPVVEPDICELATDADACVGPTPTDTAIIDRDGDGQADSIDPCPDDLLDGCLETSRSVADQDDDGGSDVPILAAQTSPPTVVEVYCDIPDINSPDLRTVGTFVDARAGYGDPTVTFTLYDLNGTVISATGSFPMPASNPITASSPYPNNWQWGPGGYSQLTVTAVYPSDDPASYPDATSSVTISCVPDAPTPTPLPPPTPDPLFTPPPSPTPAGYTPAFTTEMKDSAGGIIPDGATVSPGTGMVDIATISGLPPGTSGTVLFQLFRDNCSTYLGLVGGGVNIVADANGVAIATTSVIFTVPAVPGGFYDWRIVYTDAAVGFTYSACGPETFYVAPPLPSSGTGSARLTCFLREPAEPGRAGYKVNVSPLPATGTVEVNSPSCSGRTPTNTRP